jgi:hypothetical protein
MKKSPKTEQLTQLTEQTNFRTTLKTKLQASRVFRCWGDTVSAGFGRFVDCAERDLLARFNPSERRRYMAGEFTHSDLLIVYARNRRPAPNGADRMNGSHPPAETLMPLMRQGVPPPGAAFMAAHADQVVSAADFARGEPTEPGDPAAVVETEIADAAWTDEDNN